MESETQLNVRLWSAALLAAGLSLPKGQASTKDFPDNVTGGSHPGASVCSRISVSNGQQLINLAGAP